MNEHVFGSSFESVFISADGFQKILKLRIDRQSLKFLNFHFKYDILAILNLTGKRLEKFLLPDKVPTSSTM